MLKWIAVGVIGVMFGTYALDADAQRRLGGGRNIGQQSQPVQRQAAPPQQAPQAAPTQQGAQQAVPAKAAGATAAARPASPWRGALMGLAAGLGIAALAGWLGFGEALTMFLTAALIGFAVLLLVAFVMRRMRGPQPAYGAAGAAGATGAARARAPGTYTNVGYETSPAPLQRTSSVDAANVRPGSAMDQFARVAAPSANWSIPAGFDAAGFVARAKENFVALQKAWDSGNLDQIADFTSNDMFITLTHDLRARSGTSLTEVVALDAELLGIESGKEHLASVKFDGTLRVNGEVERVSEVWNLSKPLDGRTGWVLAGIQQV